MSKVEEILADRGSSHGDYVVQAKIAQALKGVIRSGPSWVRMTEVERDSLEMIAVKISRAVTGDPHHKDHWDDIAGYSTLVSKQLDQ